MKTIVEASAAALVIALAALVLRRHYGARAAMAKPEIRSALAVVESAERPAFVRNQPTRRHISEPALNRYGAGVAAPPAPLFLR